MPNTFLYGSLFIFPYHHSKTVVIWKYSQYWTSTLFLSTGLANLLALTSICSIPSRFLSRPLWLSVFRTATHILEYYLKASRLYIAHISQGIISWQLLNWFDQNQDIFSLKMAGAQLVFAKKKKPKAVRINVSHQSFKFFFSMYKFIW